MSPRRVLPAAVSVAAAGLVAAPAAGAAFTPFQTPSKQIQCAYISGDGMPAQIRCDLFFLNDRAVVLTHKGKPRKIRITDTVGDPLGKVLAYGKSRRFGDFTCTSRTSGLTCTSRRSKHGFTVSRQAQKLF